MLRPASPLTILLFVAFVLLLLSVISTPIVKGIPLASFKGVDFGVFGYCKGAECHGVQVGYTTGMCGTLWAQPWVQTSVTPSCDDRSTTIVPHDTT